MDTELYLRHFLSAGSFNDLGRKSEWKLGCFVNLRPNVQFQRVYVSTSEKVKRNIIFMGLGFCFVYLLNIIKDTFCIVVREKSVHWAKHAVKTLRQR